MLPYIMGFLSVIFISIGQILFRYIAPQLTIDHLYKRFDYVFWMLILALFIYAIATCFWIITLKFLPLSKAYFFTALAFIFVPIAASIILNDPYNLRIFAGSIIIILGILIAALP